MICTEQERLLIRNFIKEHLPPSNQVPGVPYKTSRNVDQPYLRQDFYANMGIKAVMMFAPNDGGRTLLNMRFTDGLTLDEITTATGLHRDAIAVQINHCIDSAIDNMPMRQGNWLIKLINKRHQFKIRGCVCGGGNKPRGTLQREHDEVGKRWEWVCINCGRRTPVEAKE
jgi:hypothetical protein